MSFSSLQIANNGLHTDGESGVIFNPDGTITEPTELLPEGEDTSSDTSNTNTTSGNTTPTVSNSTVKSTTTKIVTPAPTLAPKATSYKWIWIAGGATVAIISGFLLYLKFKKK